MKWVWPLPGVDFSLHVIDKSISHPGSFGAVRKYDVHTGVDIYCKPQQKVLAVEDGEVVLIENFTGENANPPSPWWHETKAVLIEGESGVVVYGEIEPVSELEVGQKVKQGQVLGNVITVLKKDKGLPMTMLHLELYKSGTRETVVWEINQAQPDSLLNPTENLYHAWFKR